MRKLKILVINYRSLGDSILSSPLIRALKMQVDESEVHFASHEDFLSPYVENPYVDQLHAIDPNAKLRFLLKILKTQNFDHVIDLQADSITTIAQLLSFKKFDRLKKLKFDKWLYTRFKINRLPNKHIVDQYLEAVKSLKIKKDQFGLEYFIPSKDEVEISWLPEEYRDNFIVYNIGADYNTKQLPFNKIIELCDKINKPIILIGNKKDQPLGDKVADFFTKTEHSQPFEEKLKELGKKAVVFNACGKFNDNQVASIIKQSKYVFTHDHDYMHTAAAFKKTIFSIWGNTTTYFGYYPYKTKFTVWENNKLNCRPCTASGYSACPKKHFNCMNKITFDFWLP